MLSKFKLNQLYFKDTQFANLMTRRIFNVLLIANPYDAFMLEDDGRIDEKSSMNTPRSPCAIRHVSRRYPLARRHWRNCLPCPTTLLYVCPGQETMKGLMWHEISKDNTSIFPW